jgi:thiamine kinase-like enzyme
MVREPQYNERLEREHRGLKHLGNLGFADQNTIPQVIFQGYHRDLFFVGESVLDGQPFVQRSTFDDQCRYARFVMQWMIDLGTTTRTAAAGSEVAALLTPLYERFVQTFKPTLSQQQFLKEQLDEVGRADRIPLVLRHGDPGLQNMLILPDDTVAVLDWENAEIEGVSLWDVFYFLSAYCMKVGQVKAGVSNLEAYEHYFLDESSLQSFVLDSITRYCDALQLDRNLIVPLYYMFWMYRSLKQSTMLNAARVHDALTWQILKRSMDRHDSLILRSLV